MANNGIVFDEGYVEVPLNGDKNRTLRVNPSDPNLVPRLKETLDDLNAKMDKYKDAKILDTGDGIGEASEAVKELNKELRENFDKIFYEGAADTVFGPLNPFATASNGKTIYENFVDGFFKWLEPNMKKRNESVEKAVNKYKAEYDRLPSGNA